MIVSQKTNGIRCKCWWCKLRVGMVAKVPYGDLHKECCKIFRLVYLDFQQDTVWCYFVTLSLHLSNAIILTFLQPCYSPCALSSHPQNTRWKVGPKLRLHSVSGRRWHFLILILRRGEKNQQQNNGGPRWPRFQMWNRGKMSLQNLQSCVSQVS